MRFDPDTIARKADEILALMEGTGNKAGEVGAKSGLVRLVEFSGSGPETWQRVVPSLGADQVLLVQLATAFGAMVLLARLEEKSPSDF